MEKINLPPDWIETRTLEARWPAAVSGLINLVVLFIATLIVWWVCFSNAGIFKLYTPLLGFSLVLWTLLIILWQVQLFDFWPLRRNFLVSTHPLLKGIVLSAMTIATYLALIIGVVFFLIGKFGITYFNWHSLMQYGELGQDALSTRETASWALLSLSVPFFIISVFMLLGIGKDLFSPLVQPRMGIANLSLITTISIPLFFLFFHPHLGSMFYPAQVYTAVPPWWQSLAMTNSAEYSLGVLFCTVLGIFYTIHLWDGRPWNLIDKQPWKFIVLVVGGLCLGLLIFYVQLYMMNYFWDEAYIGGQNESNFGWRYSHTVTMGNFFVVPAMILNFFFGRVFEGLTLLAKGLIKTGITLAAGLLFAWAYYMWAPVILGVVPGISHPSENASAFLLLIMNLVLIQFYFMDGWPGYRLMDSDVYENEKKSRTLVEV